MANNSLMFGYYVDFESISSMEDSGYATMISYLEASGLKEFLTAGKTVSVESLSEFFANAKVDNDVIVSSVKGVPIALTQVMFQEAFTLPNSGLLNIGGVSDKAKRKAWEILAGDSPFASGSFKKKHLKNEYQVLCDIVAKHLEYRSGAFDQLTKTKYCFLVAIVAKEEVNWSFILFQRLLKMVSHPRSNMGFGLVLSRILEKSIVDLDIASTIHRFRILDSTTLINKRANKKGPVRGSKGKSYQKKRGEENIRKTDNKKNENFLKHDSLGNDENKTRSSNSVDSDSDDAPLIIRKSKRRRTSPIKSLEHTGAVTCSSASTSQLETSKQTQIDSVAAGSETISAPGVTCIVSRDDAPVDFCNMNLSCTCALVRAQDVQEKLSPQLASCVKLVTRSQRIYLDLLKPFCYEYLPDHDQKVVFFGENVKEFSMGYRARSCRFRTGWRSFFIAHRLLEGDALVLHLIEQFKFKVYIVRSCRPKKGDHGAIHNPNVDVPIDIEDARIGIAIKEEHDLDYFSEDSHQENSTSSLNLDCTPPVYQHDNLCSVAPSSFQNLLSSFKM